MNNRLALGTAQFGFPYGIANQHGVVSRTDVDTILNYAWAMGLDTLDTAIDYGESEQRLGDIGVKQWQVISKLPAVPRNCNDVVCWVRKSVLGSLQRLKIRKLRGLLLHRPRDFLSTQGDALYRALVTCKNEGTVEKIGISIYDPDELNAILRRYSIDIVQAPLNILDRRLATSGWLTRLHNVGTEVHVRSVFLQGLLLMGVADRPQSFNRWQPLWDKWHRWLDSQRLVPLQACIGYVFSQSKIDRVVVGVQTLSQLQEILVAIQTPPVEPPPALISEDLDLIIPSRWKLR